jgi:hypothetical protein
MVIYTQEISQGMYIYSHEILNLFLLPLDTIK